MLEIIQIASPQEKKKIFENVDFNKSTWVVSDISSKLILRDNLLQKYPIVSDDYILRIHDLWCLLAQKLKPEIRWVSKECASATVRKNLIDKNLQKEGVVNLILNYIEILMPVLTHQQGQDIMAEFFEKHELSKKKWAHWYSLAQEQWEFFLNHEIALVNWASGLLTNMQDFEHVWQRTLYFDVSSNLQPIETELIKTLSRYIDVKVVTPNPVWKQEFKKALKSYEQLFDYFKLDPITASSKGTNQLDHDKKRVQYFKLTTQLAEVKSACSIVHDWLDENIPLNKIAVAAPDIKTYWPSLREYLKIEGVPSQRESKAYLLTFPDVHKWISNLKLQLKVKPDLSSGQIETSLVSENNFEAIKHDRFKQMYSKIYDEQDLNRDQGVAGYLTSKKHSSFEILNKEEFSRWAADSWVSDNFERLESILNQIYNDFTSELKFEINEWVRITEAIAAKLDTTIEPAASPGIQCVDLSLVGDMNVSHVFILGLTDQNMRKSNPVLVDDFDVKSLADGFGFTLTYPETLSLEFELNWLLENRNQKFILSYPQTDYEGQTFAPSLTWLKGGLSQESFSTTLSRFDQLMIESKNPLVEKDLGLLTPDTIAYLPTKLSPTSLEDYSKCPFIFTAKKMFHLFDLPELDLDIDYMTRGRLLHAIFDKILIEPFNFFVTDEKIIEIIEFARIEVDFFVADQRLWDSLRYRYFQFTKDFLKFEKDWRQRFPETNTRYKEYDLVGYINFETGELVKKLQPQAIPFAGKIDRVDIDSKNNAVVIDYKFSISDRNHFSKWIDKNEFQLGLYAIAIENGWIDEINFNVVGAVYYSVKDWERDKGFLLTTEGERLVQLNSRKKNNLDQNEKEELFKAIQEKIRMILVEMKNGKYFPSPQDEKTCENCNWRQMCRAPHLI